VKFVWEQMKNGEPVLDEYQMTFPQQERLFFRNSWQNDIVPQRGITKKLRKSLPVFSR
jgi:hypothetical protein